MVDSTTLDKVINKIGSAYNIRLGSVSWDNYGTGSVAWNGSIATGYVQVLNETDDSVRYGVLNVGDAIGYFKMDANFPLGSQAEVIHQGITFETISEQIIPHIAGSQLMKQVNMRRKVV